MPQRICIDCGYATWNETDTCESCENIKLGEPFRELALHYCFTLPAFPKNWEDVATLVACFHGGARATERSVERNTILARLQRIAESANWEASLPAFINALEADDSVTTRVPMTEAAAYALCGKCGYCAYCKAVKDHIHTIRDKEMEK